MGKHKRCSRRDSFCRKLSHGKRAKDACTRDGVPGTRVKAFYAPKKVCNSAQARIAAYVRHRAAHKSSGGKKKRKRSASPAPVRKSQRSNKGIAARRLIES